MRTAFYITSYNDPESCARCLEDFAKFDVAKRFECFLSDGSDSGFSVHYASLCKRHGFKHLKRINRGACDAKQKIIEHAFSEGFSFMHQISEDFRLTTADTVQTHLPTGHGGGEFLVQAMEMLLDRPAVSFVNWTFFRVGGDAGYIWGKTTPHMRVRYAKRWPLLWVEGDISLFGWPYTGRVIALADRLKEAQLMPHLNKEEALSKSTLGHGVCLLAHPVIHTNRVKPGGSLA